ncbi:GH14616 [Drosophila grimshawi]|uniref:GH14616 n=2 Tax=Drosophila grimshawi TaxID=7222 RepID=B4IY38_DROGR|nr:GH14616 [Drosophila grimshawi]
MGNSMKITTANPITWGRSVNKSSTTVATLKMAKLSKDQYGKWIYNPWSVAHGNQLKEGAVTKSSRKQERVKVAENPNKMYNPEAHLANVCTGTTIPYGKHKMVSWLDRHIYKHKHKKRVFYMDLRRDVYTKSNSEVCHNKTMTDWIEYQECSIRRNQRLESFVPKYPLDQRVREIASNKN